MERPFDCVPRDILLVILRLLDVFSLHRASSVSTLWHQLCCTLPQALLRPAEDASSTQSVFYELYEKVRKHGKIISSCARGQNDPIAYLTQAGQLFVFGASGDILCTIQGYHGVVCTTERHILIVLPHGSLSCYTLNGVCCLQFAPQRKILAIETHPLLPGYVFLLQRDGLMALYSIDQQHLQVQWYHDTMSCSRFAETSNFIVSAGDYILYGTYFVWRNSTAQLRQRQCRNIDIMIHRCTNTFDWPAVEPDKSSRVATDKERLFWAYGSALRIWSLKTGDCLAEHDLLLDICSLQYLPAHDALCAIGKGQVVLRSLQRPIDTLHKSLDEEIETVHYDDVAQKLFVIMPNKTVIVYSLSEQQELYKWWSK